MNKIVLDAKKVQEAIDIIASGTCKRVDINDDTKVYSVKNVIRIDIKAPSDV